VPNPTFRFALFTIAVNGAAQAAGASGLSNTWLPAHIDNFNCVMEDEPHSIPLMSQTPPPSPSPAAAMPCHELGSPPASTHSSVRAVYIDGNKLQIE
jgi:hypothetical protein